ncbi:MAG: MEDS domain-containing protein [Nitrososphaeraceae archaeon]
MVGLTKNNQHLLLLYNDKTIRDSYVCDFINEGLTNDELCIYGTVSLRDKNTFKIASKIVNYKKNIEEGNLLIVDLAPMYVRALTGDLGLFEKFKKDVLKRIKKRINKHVRFVGDCASFLFENKQFSQCLAVESWWHRRPIRGKYLCPYQKSFINQYPYNFHIGSIIENKHDKIIDTDGSTTYDYKKVNDYPETEDSEEFNRGGSNIL